jgi:hypothetical protein
MKPTHLLLAALFALTVGCKSTETLSSGGTEDAKEPEVVKQDEAPASVDGGTNPVDLAQDPLEPKSDDPPKTDPLSTTGATKPVEKPAPGAAAENKAITAKSLVGVYDGKLFEETIKFILSIAPPESRAEAESELRSATISLELTADGKYTMLTKSKKASETNTGTWTYDEKTGIATMGAPDVNPDQVAKLKARGATDEQIAASRNQTMQCQVSKDGRTLTFEQVQGGMRNGITFTKK